MNANENIEFRVFRLESVDSNRCALIGRCYQGVLRLGSVFTSACEVLGVSEDGSPVLGQIFPIDIRVIGIEIYGSKIPFLDEGLSAKLIVTGMPCKDIK